MFVCFLELNFIGCKKCHICSIILVVVFFVALVAHEEAANAKIGRIVGLLVHFGGDELSDAFAETEALHNGGTHVVELLGCALLVPLLVQEVAQRVVQVGYESIEGRKGHVLLDEIVEPVEEGVALRRGEHFADVGAFARVTPKHVHRHGQLRTCDLMPPEGRKVEHVAVAHQTIVTRRLTEALDHFAVQIFLQLVAVDLRLDGAALGT